jgi:hypothetical protein
MLSPVEEDTKLEIRPLTAEGIINMLNIEGGK